MFKCPKCGEEVPFGAKYCPKCGFRVEFEQTSYERPQSGFNNLRYDYRAQGLWIARFLAYLIDSVIVGIFALLGWTLLILPFLIGSIFTGNWWSWRNIVGYPFAFGLFQVAYFTVLEGWYGASIGKQIIGLRVVANSNKKPSFIDALVRNISKIHGGFLLLDLLFGLTLSKEPDVKATDRISGTRVIKIGGISLGPIFTTQRKINDVFRKPSSPIWEEKTREEGFDVLSGIGFGVFLIVLAFIFINFPGIHLVFIGWVTELGQEGIIIPPKSLLEPVFWLFAAMGVWGIISGLLRGFMRTRLKNYIDEIFGGFFSIVIAYLLWQYVIGRISWGLVWPGFIIGLGGLIVLSTFTNYLVR